MRALRVLSIPLLFCGVAIGLVALQSGLQPRRAALTPAPAAESLAPIANAQAAIAYPQTKYGDLAAAADKGDLAARLELGRRFANGNGVKKSESRAAEYFQGIIAEFGETGARDVRAPLIASAFLQMARLYQQGIADADLDPDPAYAFSLVHHAASYIADPAAQFELARLLMDGDGITKNTRAAAQWLLSASRKGYAPAQALLGEILWTGRDGVRRVPGDGLGLLAIAHRNASNEDKAWVGRIFESARDQAAPSEILEANAFIVQEASAARFPVSNDILINGARRDEVATTLPVAPSSIAPLTQGPFASPLIGTPIMGTSKALTELEATPMSAPDPTTPLYSVDQKDGGAAGIIEMYRARTTDARSELASKTKLAGVGE
ncbi:sel1 repeat family protein [Rhodomicrobium sp. Az07]|uniref:tetratricopeptide repeat protein n=1 Tax=Rhodomicrobium sp. Az07 TaxID=2839034 RepID=UPI001BEB4944|nr:tetratricopeptide repeat protein [Rhodomicrobium sp. Az07]MBT3071373.1 sel1 repeat family protein [Rhodomicrobium sp. Az07]